MRTLGAESMAAGAMVLPAALLGWGVRGRSSTLFGESVWRGPRGRRAVALTFDDGPSEGTLEVLDILERHRARGTFFQCGMNVRRLPEIAQRVQAEGHEIGNHGETHTALYMKAAGFIRDEFALAQESIEGAVGMRPRWLRAPFGGRWFGFREMQRELSLTGVMWTVIGQDWRQPAAAVVKRVMAKVDNGAIICLHDGRGVTARPDVRVTIEAVKRIVPALLERGFELRTVSELLCPTK